MATCSGLSYSGCSAFLAVAAGALVDVWVWGGWGGGLGGTAVPAGGSANNATAATAPYATAATATAPPPAPRLHLLGTLNAGAIANRKKYMSNDAAATVTISSVCYSPAGGTLAVAVCSQWTGGRASKELGSVQLWAAGSTMHPLQCLAVLSTEHM